MKRRGFLVALAAVMAAPKALMALVPRSSEVVMRPITRPIIGARLTPDLFDLSGNGNHARVTLDFDASDLHGHELDAFGNVTLIRDLSGR